jgi:hypothetical protein
MKTVDIVFDRLPDHESPRFIEVENAQGRSIKFGEWVKRDDGLAALRITDASGLARALTTLREVAEFLDNLADADDGIPNDAMRLLVEVKDTIAAAI